MSTRLTTLCENTALPGFKSEWGLSIFLETGGSRVLLDTGAGTSILHNTDLLQVDLEKTDAIVLSHGHSDHTGGLRQVLARTGPVRIIAHRDVWKEKFSLRSGKSRSIGIPFEQNELESMGATFTLSAEPVWLTPQVVTTGEVPMVNDFEFIHQSLCHRHSDNLEPDPLNDDLALAVITPVGLVIVLGCAHRGAINTINRLREVTEEERVCAVIGGTHLLDASTQRIDKTIEALKEMSPNLIACAHCTGLKAQAAMAKAFEEKFVFLEAGVQLTLP